MKTESFETLTNKIEAFVAKYDVARKEKDRIEALVMKKERENLEIKKRLEKVLKERDMVRRKLDGIIEKIDGLDIV